MVKFYCHTLELEDNTYRAASGREYFFRKKSYGQPTEVTDEDDIAYFRSKPGQFEEVSDADSNISDITFE